MGNKKPVKPLFYWSYRYLSVLNEPCNGGGHGALPQFVLQTKSYP